MGVTTTLYVVTLGVAIVLAAALAVVTFRNRSEPAMRWFTAIMASVVLWSTGQVVETLATGYRAAAAGTYAKYLGIVGATYSFFVFALSYTDNEEYVTPRTLALLAAYPVGTTLAIWTNPLHGLFWSDTGFDPGAVSTFENPAGPLFWVYAVVGYAMFVTGSILLARLYYRSQSLYRGQILALLVGVFVPLVANSLYLAGVIQYDLTPAAFVVTGVAVLSAVRWFDFSTLTPVARDTVVDTMRGGVFVFDAEDRLRDVNPAGREMVGGGTGIVGQGAEAVLGAVPGLYDRYGDLEEGDEVVTVDAGDRIERYRLEVTPLSSGRNGDSGSVVVVRDVTGRFERERELERQNEQLEQFASLVSHDLRNPLSVASGYVELIQDRTEDPEIEEYADEVARSHDRMRRIIEDVLTMARQGQTIDETESVELGVLAERAWSNVVTGEATLENDLASVVEADRDRLLHVFENLFRNGIEHAGPDVTVRVGPISRPSVENGDGVGAGFFVADDGPGIPADRREAVFEAGHTTATEGTGLGLAIVEQFVEAHGWSIEVTESESGGARFEVTGVPGIEPPEDPVQGLCD